MSPLEKRVSIITGLYPQKCNVRRRDWEGKGQTQQSRWRSSWTTEGAGANKTVWVSYSEGGLTGRDGTNES